MADDILIRPLAPSDSMAEMTALLHRAYGSLAEKGFRYLASYQTEEETRRRAGRGECHVGIRDGRIVATISLRPGSAAEGTPRYQAPDISVFGQFAVEPALQRSGIGSRLMDLVERRAGELGSRRVACDTAEGAVHLIRYYEKRGYRVVGHVRWDASVVNYRSVILEKLL